MYVFWARTLSDCSFDRSMRSPYWRLISFAWLQSAQKMQVSKRALSLETQSFLVTEDIAIGRSVVVAFNFETQQFECELADQSSSSTAQSGRKYRISIEVLEGALSSSCSYLSPVNVSKVSPSPPSFSSPVKSHLERPTTSGPSWLPPFKVPTKNVRIASLAPPQATDDPIMMSPGCSTPNKSNRRSSHHRSPSKAQLLLGRVPSLYIALDSPDKESKRINRRKGKSFSVLQDDSPSAAFRSNSRREGASGLPPSPHNHGLRSFQRMAEKKHQDSPRRPNRTHHDN